MMKHEFDELAGQVSDFNMYNNEIEPTYMMFNKITKQALAKAYWGNGDRRVARDGGYGLWMELNDLRKEIQKCNTNPDNHWFQDSVIKAAELFKRSDVIVEKMNRL